jgi:Uma2 family endonuclease
VSTLTEQQYITIERAAHFKSEFLDGVMYERSGISLIHCSLAGNILCELRPMLRHSECQAFGSDLRVRVSGRMYAYPDASVVRGKPLLTDDQEDVPLNPVVSFEVNSPLTDLGLKFQLYRAMASLREYILVDQDKVWVEQYTRQDDGTRILRDHKGKDAELKMDSIGATVPLRLIYEGVDLAS